MNMRKAILAALRGEEDLRSQITNALRKRMDENQESPMTTMVAAAEALEPIIASAVKRNPSRLSILGLKSAHLLASLAAEDEVSNGRLAAIAQNQTVGIVFIDVAGFTQYTADHGDDAAIELLGKLSTLISRSTRAGKGEIVKSLGDGFLLAFPSASQAVRGAVSVRDGSLALRRKDPDFPAQLRIAVHAGEPLIEQDDLLGHDVNITARLLDHCEPDEIVVSEAACELAERRLKKISFDHPREVKIRGLATRVGIVNANPVDRLTLSRSAPVR